MSKNQISKKAIPKPTHFGKNLKLLRKLNNLSQQQLATALDVKRNNIASYESGVVEPNAKLFLKVCAFFNKKPTDILETVLIENVSDYSSVKEEHIDSAVEVYLLEHIEQFIVQTNEMSKIYEGYTALVEMKSKNANDQSSIELYASLTDLLDLLQSLIKLNWDTIQTLFPNAPHLQNQDL